ncbi:MAG: hypothetical protein PHW95_00075 [Patescibacteria group bacterium]|nr:hypothetical protein [Patescibacteria group bacterium]
MVEFAGCCLVSNSRAPQSTVSEKENNLILLRRVLADYTLELERLRSRLEKVSADSDIQTTRRRTRFELLRRRCAPRVINLLQTRHHQDVEDELKARLLALGVDGL